MTIIIILCHLVVDGLCGLAILQRLEKEDWSIFTFIKALGIGMFVDTMLLGIFHYLGISILAGFIIFSICTVIFYLINLKSLKFKPGWKDSILKKRLSIWEVFLLLIISEKYVWSLVNLNYLPIYFDDALNHWSGRGKAMLSGVNWSWDPESVHFLGQAFGHVEYPLFISIWRATNTALLGGANGASERADGVIMALIVTFTTLYWVNNKTGKRWMGLLAAALIGIIPLQAWHMTAGYAEIFIQAYLLLAIWSIMNDRYILAGIFSAALIWSKNEGLILFVPCLLMCLAFRLLFDKNQSIGSKFQSFMRYNLSWVIGIAPWLLFKLINGVGFTIPGKKGIEYVDGSLDKMLGAIVNSPSSTILWIFILTALIVGSVRIAKNRELFILTAGALFLMVMMTFVFTCTGAYIFLENQMTIHRSLLQIAPIFIIVSVLALSNSGNNVLVDVE